MFEAIFWVALIMAAISWLMFLDQVYHVTGLPKVSIERKAGADIDWVSNPPLMRLWIFRASTEAVRA